MVVHGGEDIYESNFMLNLYIIHLFFYQRNYYVTPRCPRRVFSCEEKDMEEIGR